MSDRPKIRIVKKDQDSSGFDEASEDKYVEKSTPQPQNIPIVEPENIQDEPSDFEAINPQRKLTYTERLKLKEEA